ncbi:MAG: RluA family pseudouridine synthase [bacterium]
MDSITGRTERVRIEVPLMVADRRVDSFLADHADVNITRSRIQQLIALGLLKVNGKTVGKNTKVKAGDLIELEVVVSQRPSLGGEDIPLSIVFEDKHLLVINKPPGLVTHPAPGSPTGTLVNAVVHYLGAAPGGGDPARPGIVHRLDKNTSGLIIVAKSSEAFSELQLMIQNRTVKRQYLALICGQLKDQEGIIDLPIGRSIKNRKKMAVTNLHGREARTGYRVLDRYRSYDLLEVTLQTGRTHQIRVHLSHLGHPVLGDPDYGGRDKWHRGIFAPERPLAKEILAVMQHQALHAYKLEFEHPIEGGTLNFQAEPPVDFQTILDLLDREGR